MFRQAAEHPMTIETNAGGQLYTGDFLRFMLKWDTGLVDPFPVSIPIAYGYKNLCKKDTGVGINIVQDVIPLQLQHLWRNITNRGVISYRNKYIDDCFKARVANRTIPGVHLMQVVSLITSCALECMGQHSICIIHLF